MLFSNNLTATLTLTAIFLVGTAVMVFTWYESATMRARHSTLENSEKNSEQQPLYVNCAPYLVIRLSVVETEVNDSSANKDLFISKKVGPNISLGYRCNRVVPE